MHLNVLKKKDYLYLNLDTAKIGVGYLVTTEDKFRPTKKIRDSLFNYSLFRMLCFSPYSFPARMINTPEGYPRDRIDDLIEAGILRKNNKFLYELNFSYFKAKYLKSRKRMARLLGPRT